ncbi:single-stranded DNA-binding protein [Corynebacterium glutamicum]|uniref:Single-stranded DNA-binding protein n=1 Tax=Corynebacterium glutamicum (strain ATCC 13032 / DSM 20300 / JCM 1318 / BCRC 11384 / CCUG 27702 / LMG 3730 / NBRC 12168 / NCIMB 10025 / NRRL B-2784 / 534) TaxID=196627 RepID=Q8NPF0_CORGL|nr:single-stranded DNA-binding protein [Corynebacterium glutamicum]AUI01343.1 single-stranded DNA-binding protein [Corynebacterium glutamicum]AUI04991.1 single-stranded DNA-binding protein [Corynebacterium glutamicum]MBA4571784.1 single-stranded DNA-binding protein [Corynebacterium glutamicum]MBA4574719.1 single-stranded DNA-binding protein [Corynebacterium glutamicum]MBA4577648.1 single-stranded DNA-binding protein [Corynebacterium glutamicum]
MSANPSNNFNVIGRLAADPKIFTNPDGSRNIQIAVYSTNNFANRNGVYEDSIVPLTQFYSASKEGNGIYSYLKEGDQVAVNGYIHQDQFTDKSTGAKRYELNLSIDSIQPLETKSAADARRARKQVVEANKAQAAAQQAPAPVQQFAAQDAPQYAGNPFAGLSQTQAPVAAQVAPQPQYVNDPYAQPQAGFVPPAPVAPQVDIDPRFI